MFNKSLERRISIYGVTNNMWYYLRALEDEGGASVGELSDRLGITGPTAVQILRELEDKQLVKRTPDQNDRRRVVVELTARGLELKQAILAHAIDVQSVAMGAVSEADKEIFQAVLGEIRKALQADQAPPP